MSIPQKRFWGKQSKKKQANYDQNDGISGVVYILTNRGLAWDYLKIGCSRYSGEKRATALNRDANTGTPGQFKCSFQQKTLDCGLAEKRVFERLKEYRAPTYKKGQEFFKIDHGLARSVLIEECEKVDLEHKERAEAKRKETSEEPIKKFGTRRMAGRYAVLKDLDALKKSM